MESSQAINNKFFEQARKMGCIKMRVFRIQKYVWGKGKMWLPFSYHFFDNSDMELCYYIEDLKDNVPMTILEQPREWSDEFKSNIAYETFDMYDLDFL